ncbi:MAG: YigZ family protein [Chitinophagaceae bacterium]|nr:YigZ family protein [Chitinophagaceae bacterium]
MVEQEFYNTIERPSQAEFKDKGSRFIAYAYPLQETGAFKALLQGLKKEHPKAVHHCFAYRTGTDGNTFRVSDDGEPSGTAGKQILGQIDSKQLTDILVVVVRYFGGTLLGVPGLINAYKTVTSFALQLSPVVRKAVEKQYSIQFDYTQVNEVMVILKQYNCRILSQEMQLFCVIRTGIPIARVEEVLYQLREIRNVDVSV